MYRYTSSFIAVVLLAFTLHFLAADSTATGGHWLLASTKNAYPDGFPSGSSVFTYDTDGKLLRVVERNGSDIVVIQRSYVYKSDGGIEITTLDPDNNVRAKTIQVFGTGLLLAEKVLDASGTVQSQSTFLYDSKGRKIDWQLSSTVSGSTEAQYTYEGNRLIRIAVLDSGKALMKRYERNFDNAGNLMRLDEFDGNGNLMRATFYSWNSGLLGKEETRDPNGVTQKTISYSYDALGHPVRLEFYNKRGELTEYQTQEWLNPDAQRGVN